ncbi:Aspartyl-tRNA(Asn) amidotransferase subunit B/Glutamyl-tRNA(Gln) amidotransferase subunit B [Coxiella-like endosymbiont]|uniref:Asp-tRNA(Asn)/Glu-tRNA(Gln) amidotransferase subunit GatB n=1 Tax=Coxiella endosymbiont of Rhipicephalus microplus TaxID=1656186 RepID=UPI000C7FEAF9|nr:Asp-tRNA(Asn)/Glu-tRNA(Gln) amidotransferase subunit GatB [Coxiella endosymbiont of Rhipicephalus microplus]PMB54677.1 Aspartyl-tRNA(Asn) amidotransferase subunit B/Glutamyl-tRNA(Gln) amidotransferase subunit B [Coxiella-like endosymbiont]
MEWEPVIGLEVHVQLRTKSKIFSGASTAYGAEPNTQACAIDLGLPGVLPVLNKEVIKLAIRFGLAIQATIANHSIFTRKNYFYPDLPKGYQISQYDSPVIKAGHLDIKTDQGSSKRIGIAYAHLEEDAGKSIHKEIQGYSSIDFNRAGAPLLEIVSEPDICSSKEAVAYLKALHMLVRYIGVSDANMQQGAFRCDVNISLRAKGEKQFGTRTEIKNVNSFRFVERAILFEIARQKKLLEAGKKIIQETRLYDAVQDKTRTMRTKEEAHDYRYFPDPDLLSLEITPELIDSIKRELPELPEEKRRRFQEIYQLGSYEVKLLTQDMEAANYFEALLKIDHSISPKLAVNWITGDLTAALNKNNLEINESPINAEQLAGLLRRISDNTLSDSMAKQVFQLMWNAKGKVNADAIIEREGLHQITDIRALTKIIDEIIKSNPQQVEEYRSGKIKLFAFFIGQIMKASKGKANPQQVTKLLKKKL